LDRIASRGAAADVANCNCAAGAQRTVAIARATRSTDAVTMHSKLVPCQGGAAYFPPAQGIDMTISRFCRRARPAALASALLFAFGGAAFAHGPGPGFGGPRGGASIEHAIAHVKDRLGLDSSQQVMFDAALAATKAARQQGRAEIESLRNALRAELAKPEPDLAALAARSDAAQANGQALRRQVRDEWLKLYSTFSPQQKTAVRDLLARRLERHERFRERMRERFGG
jgi:Spy/CpxP family protein refolding chaperone